MIEVAEHFVLLEAQARDVAGSQLLTRAVGVKISGRDMLAAIDAVGQKHLLIPLMANTVDGDNASQGVTLGSRVLRTASGDVTYADLHCRISSLALVFERLAQDVLERLAVDDSAPVSTCRKVLDEWRALLKAAGQSVSREMVIGLVGELEVLRLLATHNPAGALEEVKRLTQNLPNFLDAYGRDGKHKVDTLLGNHATKIFHRNGDPTTNEWASKVIAKETTYKHSLSNSGSLQSSSGFSSNTSVTEVEEDSCPPKEFIGLKNGGKKNDYTVEGILFQSGRLWNKNQRWTVRRFKQT